MLPENTSTYVHLFKNFSNLAFSQALRHIHTGLNMKQSTIMQPLLLPFNPSSEFQLELQEDLDKSIPTSDNTTL